MRSVLAFPIALLLVAPGTATAASIGFSTATQGCLGTVIGFGNCSIGGAADGPSLVGTFSGSGDTLAVSAAAQAAYGSLGASASASYNVTGPATNAFATGGATFIDLITISYAPWDGLPGLLSVSYILDGTISSTGNGQGFARAILFFDPSTANAQTRQNLYFASTSGVFSLGAPLHFTYGQPFVFDFSLFTCAGRGDVCIAGPATGVGSANVDFFNTIVLSGLIPTDLSGTQAVGAQFTSASGTQYGVNGVAPVPEPASILLLGTGLAATVSRFKRRRSTPNMREDTLG